MSNQRWRFLERAYDDLANDAHSNGLDVTLVDRLEAAAAGSDKARLEDASKELVEFQNRLYAMLPDDLRKTLRDGTGDRNVQLAYAMGQVAFAQLFASRVADRRAPDEVVQALSNPRFIPFLDALSGDEISGRDLAVAVGQTPENVSRVIAELRILGLVDFRRQGQSLLNFLTPMASAAYTAKADPDA